jgi:ABC-type transport system involved in multi-copper enzyme maturation permease subunit
MTNMEAIKRIVIVTALTFLIIGAVIGFFLLPNWVIMYIVLGILALFVFVMIWGMIYSALYSEGYDSRGV